MVQAVENLLLLLFPFCIGNCCCKRADGNIKMSPDSQLSSDYSFLYISSLSLSLSLLFQPMSRCCCCIFSNWLRGLRERRFSSWGTLIWYLSVISFVRAPFRLSQWQKAFNELTPLLSLRMRLVCLFRKRERKRERDRCGLQSNSHRRMDRGQTD